MRNEFLVTVTLVILFHLFKCVSIGRIRRMEHPRALRTSPALKIPSFSPHEFASHRQRISRPLKKGEDIGFLYRSYEQRRT